MESFFEEEHSLTYIHKNKVDVVYKNFKETNQVRYQGNLYTISHRLPQKGEWVIAFRSNFNYQYEAYEVFRCIKREQTLATLAMLPHEIVEFNLYEQDCYTAFAVLIPIKSDIE